ncbi:MAG: SpoIIE family protein phosphatase [Coriobacteriales bacterium]|nr:SpoIIE family protein phosphatase [Coriobacteriales bacterium]
MKRSILSRFAIFSAVGLAIAICISVLLSNWYNSSDIAAGYYARASIADDEVQSLFFGMTYDELFSNGESETYEQMRTALRSLCQDFGAEYAYMFEMGEDQETRTYLFCVAEDDNADTALREIRPLGAQSNATLAQQELDAIHGAMNSDPDVTDNEFGNDLCWYFPFEIDGSTKPIVFGIDFDVAKEQLEIWEYTLSFIIPLLFGIVCIVIFELILLKQSVADPLRTLAGRMRRFTQDGTQNKEHIAVGKTAEIADIETSFNQMTDDIDTYVGRIAQMCEERVAVETELEVARRIQHGLVPPTTQCEEDRYNAYAFERTARAVGGDFYDLTVLKDGKLLLVIADVSGKGVSAALFMAMFRTLVYDKLQANLNPAHALNEANDTLVSNNPENMFATLIAGVFDPATGVLTFANAGHTPPLMVGGTYLTPDPGIALGLFEDAGIVNETLVLKPGEGVLFYTDGATEAVGPQSTFFGEDRLMQAVREQKDAKGAVHAAVDAVDAFAEEQEQFDDLTLLALFATGDGGMDWQATLAPELRSFPEVREHIVELCGTGPQAKQVVLACDEAFANVVHYSGATAVDVSLHVAGNEVVARISDDGVPFDPLAHDGEERAFEDLDMGGMGIMLIREACDDVAYEYVDGRNVLTMRFGLAV